MNSPNIPLQSLNPEDNILESAPLAAEFTGTFFVVLTQASKASKLHGQFRSSFLVFRVQDLVFRF